MVTKAESEEQLVKFVSALLKSSPIVLQKLKLGLNPRQEKSETKSFHCIETEDQLVDVVSDFLKSAPANELFKNVAEIEQRVVAVAGKPFKLIPFAVQKGIPNLLEFLEGKPDIFLVKESNFVMLKVAPSVSSVVLAGLGTGSSTR